MPLTDGDLLMASFFLVFSLTHPALTGSGFKTQKRKEKTTVKSQFVAHSEVTSSFYIRSMSQKKQFGHPSLFTAMFCIKHDFYDFS